jgi:hypothetical protein
VADERALRLAQNEGIMREVNERIDDIAQTLGGGDHRYDFLCECSRLDCVQRIGLTLAEYAHVRDEGERFAILAGHEAPRIERVIEKHDDYWIVEKVGVAGEAARDADPRSE